MILRRWKISDYCCCCPVFVHSVGGVCDEAADKAAEAVSTGVSPCRGKTAILSRCNLTVFSEAVSLTDANPHCRIHFVGVSVYKETFSISKY